MWSTYTAQILDSVTSAAATCLSFPAFGTRVSAAPTLSPSHRGILSTAAEMGTGMKQGGVFFAKFSRSK